jgi:hypothetical protein
MNSTHLQNISKRGDRVNNIVTKRVSIQDSKIKLQTQNKDEHNCSQEKAQQWLKSTRDLQL